MNPTILLIGALVATFSAALLLVASAKEPAGIFLARRVDAYHRMVGELLVANFSPVRPDTFGLRHLVAVIAGMIATYLLADGLVEMLVAGVALYFLPIFWLRRLNQQRKQRFEAQLEDALVIMSNALKTSPTLPDAIQLAIEAIPPPMSEELSLVLNDVKVGASIEGALARLSERMKSADLDMALIAISVGRAVGGNLSRMLDLLATTLREMKRLQGLIESKTAEGRMQARVMGSMPVAFAGLIYFIDPKMITPLFTESMGLLLLGIIVFLQLTGVILIRKVSRLDV